MDVWAGGIGGDGEEGRERLVGPCALCHPSPVTSVCFNWGFVSVVD